MGYVHSIKEHERLVKKLMAKIDKDYIEYRDKSLENLSILDGANKDVTVDILSTRFTILSFVKHRILDDNGNIFYGFGQSVSDTEREYMIDSMELKILVEANTNFCAQLESFARTSIAEDRICTNFDITQFIGCICDKNIGHMVSIFDKIAYRKGIHR